MPAAEMKLVAKLWLVAGAAAAAIAVVKAAAPASASERAMLGAEVDRTLDEQAHDLQQRMSLNKDIKPGAPGCYIIDHDEKPYAFGETFKDTSITVEGTFMKTQKMKPLPSDINIAPVGITHCDGKTPEQAFAVAKQQMNEISVAAKKVIQTSWRPTTIGWASDHYLIIAGPG